MESEEKKQRGFMDRTTIAFLIGLLYGAIAVYMCHYSYFLYLTVFTPQIIIVYILIMVIGRKK